MAAKLETKRQRENRENLAAPVEMPEPEPLEPRPNVVKEGKVEEGKDYSGWYRMGIVEGTPCHDHCASQNVAGFDFPRYVEIFPLKCLCGHSWYPEMPHRPGKETSGAALLQGGNLKYLDAYQDSFECSKCREEKDEHIRGHRVKHGYAKRLPKVMWITHEEYVRIWNRLDPTQQPRPLYREVKRTGPDGEEKFTEPTGRSSGGPKMYVWTDKGSRGRQRQEYLFNLLFLEPVETPVQDDPHAEERAKHYQTLLALADALEGAKGEEEEKTVKEEMSKLAARIREL